MNLRPLSRLYYGPNSELIANGATVIFTFTCDSRPNAIDVWRVTSYLIQYSTLYLVSVTLKPKHSAGISTFRDNCCLIGHRMKFHNFTSPTLLNVLAFVRDK